MLPVCQRSLATHPCRAAESKSQRVKQPKNQRSKEPKSRRVKEPKSQRAEEPKSQNTETKHKNKTKHTEIKRISIKRSKSFALRKEWDGMGWDGWLVGWDGSGVGATDHFENFPKTNQRRTKAFNGPIIVHTQYQVIEIYIYTTYQAIEKDTMHLQCYMSRCGGGGGGGSGGGGGGGSGGGGGGRADRLYITSPSHRIASHPIASHPLQP